MKNQSLDFFESKDDKIVKAIRTAYKAGRRTIVIKGRKFKLELQQHHSHKADEARTPHTQDWILVKPADGALIPMAQIERVKDGNSKVIAAK
jgi:hypothetical protein